MMELMASPVIGLLVGLLFGLGYFRVLRWTAEQVGRGEGWGKAATLTAGRVLAAALLLGLAVQFGALTLLATFLGFLVARALALRAARRAG